MLFNRTAVDRMKTEKWPAVSRYLDELLIQKCQFRGHFEVSSLSLEKLSPKGSCHLDESSMNHTLAQKHLCEF